MSGSRIFDTDLSWILLDLDEEQSVLDRPENLADLCAQKLLSDLSLLYHYLPGLPNQIYSVLLSSAINQKWILPINQLLRRCPYEKEKLSIPDSLKSLHTIHKNEESRITIFSRLNDFQDIAVVIVTAFLDLIDNNNNHSQLQYIDLGDIPVSFEVFYLVHTFLIKKKPAVANLQKQYTLKCAVAIEKSTDAFMLCSCIETAKAIGFQFIITGVSYCNNYYPDLSIMDLFELLNVLDLNFISFSFTNVIPSVEPILHSIQYFKFVKYLKISYLSDLRTREPHLKMLSSTLTELPCLERLVLKGLEMKSQLTDVLLQFCKKQTEVTAKECCIIHNGRLKFLDVSSCKLADRDIEVLKELAKKNSLKYLNISDNYLEPDSTFETLLSLKYSLCVLEMDDCFEDEVEYDSKVFPLRNFEKLKYLSWKGLKRTVRADEMLSYELSKVPNLNFVCELHDIYLPIN